MQKNIKRGVRLTAALIVMLMLVNSLLPTYGDTLTTYLGMSGSSSSDSAMSDASNFFIINFSFSS
jgi:hypothetical protein